MTRPLSRRSFLKTAAASAVLARASIAAAPTPLEALNELSYSAVTLTGGPLKHHYDQIHAHYLALDIDRLLKVYRQRAGLPAPGKDMGGWYDTDGFVPGHTLGQYISGLARIGASTNDPACHAKVNDLVTGFAATLGPDNQSILRPQSNLWICYTLDKHFVGLIDAASLSNIPASRDLLSRVLDGAQPLLPAQGHDRIGKKDPPYDETYVMPENLFSAHQITGNPAFRDLALKYLLNREYFDPLARGENPLPGQHAYSHAIALSSAGKAYLTLADAKYKRAMQNAFTLLTTQQQFASGGWGPNETFITPHKGELYNSLSTTVDHFETPCGAYAATKLARYLLRFTADPQYGDNLERVLFNTILSAKSPDSNGDYPYYSTYSPQATKVFYPKKWPCCSGTLVQTVADYVLNLYFHSPNGLYVNLYAPSEVRFTHNDTPIQLIQQTQYPLEDTTSLRVITPRPIPFTLYLRIPAWLTQPAQININGRPITITASPGTFTPIHRTWSNNDHIDLHLPQSFRTEPIDELHPNTAALMRGSVQYVALNPSSESASQHFNLPANLTQIAPQAFTQNETVFVPFYAIQNETYTTYFNLA